MRTTKKGLKFVKLGSIYIKSWRLEKLSASLELTQYILFVPDVTLVTLTSTVTAVVQLPKRGF